MHTTSDNNMGILTKNKNIQGEIQLYTKNRFKHHAIAYQQLPSQVDDAQIPTWERYVRLAHEIGTYQVLKKILAPFQFPIEAGIGKLPAYKAATLRGKSTQYTKEATGLILKQPDSLQLEICDSINGKIPVLTIADPQDFETVIRALAYKNEPINIPESMGASIINGLNNWDRINALRKEWKGTNPNGNWPLFFRKNILPHKSLYQDKLIVLSKKPYSNVKADMIGLNDEAWLKFSHQIRLEHECAHYFTYSHLGGMYVHLHDELIADYMGITKVLGYFNSDWFLAFMGLQKETYKLGSRMENYLAKSGLSSQAILILEQIMRAATKHVAAFNQKIQTSNNQQNRIAQLITLSSIGLDEIAAKNGSQRLIAIYRRITENFPMQGNPPNSSAMSAR